MNFICKLKNMAHKLTIETLFSFCWFAENDSPLWFNNNKEFGWFMVMNLNSWRQKLKETEQMTQLLQFYFNWNHANILHFFLCSFLDNLNRKLIQNDHHVRDTVKRFLKAVFFSVFADNCKLNDNSKTKSKVYL